MRQEKQVVNTRDDSETVQALASRVGIPRKSNEWGRDPCRVGC